MPQAITSLTSILPLLSAGSQVATGASSLYQGYENQKYQDQLRALAGDPTKFNAYAQQFVQPLNAGLIKGVENEAQGYAAERGLGSSPSLTEDIVSQAIAPYVQQNQQQGYSEALSALGLGGGAQPSNPSAGLTSLFAGLKGLSAPASLSALKGLAASGGPATYDTSTYGGMIPSVPDPGLQDIYASSFGGQ